MTDSVRLSGTVIFVRDVTAMAAFYATLTGWSVVEKGRGFVRLGANEQQIVLHAAQGVSDDPAEKIREWNPLKVVLTVADRSALRLVSDAGGHVLAQREFTHAGRCHVDVVDIEGNILQLVFPA